LPPPTSDERYRSLFCNSMASALVQFAIFSDGFLGRDI